MTGEVFRTPLARLDLIDIWQFIAADNETAADHMLDRIERALAMLRDHSLAGRMRPELLPDIRSFPVGSYVLFYRVLPEGIQLVRVLSGYRDIHAEDVE